MDINLINLANRSISQLIPYQPGKPIEEVERELGIPSAIKLASNENPLGTSEHTLKAIREALNKIHIYPDGGCYAIKNKLSKILNVSAKQLTIGNGSENILELITKSFLNSKTSAIISEYAFLTIQLLIQSYGARMLTIPADNFKHDIKKMIAEICDDTRIIFIVNPNNPTGTYTNAKDLKLLLESVPTSILVVVDEAYHEYINCPDFPNTLELLPHYPNLIITRTFSKAYGLSALRLGYAVSSPEIADILNRARLPFNVNFLAEVAGCAALEDQEFIKETIALNNSGMQQMTAGLKKLNLEYIPSLGNFVSINLKQDAQLIYQKLLYKGIIVRPLGAYKMPNFIRVTIGKSFELMQFLEALENVLCI